MKKSLIIIAISAALFGCGEDRPTPVVAPAPVVQAPMAVASQPQPQVIIVQQPAAAPAHNTTGDAMVGSMVGSAVGTMIGNSLSRPSVGTSMPSNGPTTVINKTVVVKNYTAPAVVPTPVKPAPLPSVSNVAPSKVIPAAPSKVTTTTATKLSLSKPAPSVSKSFGGFRRR